MPRSGGKISVIIPTHNRAHFLRQSVDSVLSQTYENFEIIIIDNNSTDNTTDLLKNYNDRRIKYVKNSENNGCAGGRNQGIEMARGDYITFLDSDDELFSTKFEKQLMKLHTLPNKFGLIYCGFCYASGKTGQIIKNIYPEIHGNVYDNLLEMNLFPVHAAIIKRECFQKCGVLDASLPACEDWDIWIRIAKYYEFGFVPDILAKYNIHGEQMATDIESMILARKRIVEKNKSELKSRPRLLGKHLKEIASLYCRNDQPAEGRKYFLASIRSYPLNYQCYIHLCLSLLCTRVHKKIIENYSVLTIDNVTLTF
jgi:glycosyltransferase involved in cell wall biosynthesis